MDTSFEAVLLGDLLRRVGFLPPAGRRATGTGRRAALARRWRLARRARVRKRAAARASRRRNRPGR